jgi:hypothetical protein
MIKATRRRYNTSWQRQRNKHQKISSTSLVHRTWGLFAMAMLTEEGWWGGVVLCGRRLKGHFTVYRRDRERYSAKGTDDSGILSCYST